MVVSLAFFISHMVHHCYGWLAGGCYGIGKGDGIFYLVSSFCCLGDLMPSDMYVVGRLLRGLVGARSSSGYWLGIPT
ncbi:hypothetical protein QBC39DRAFT_135722 [Podospora conica]|nr:hypothetical protein QBC39DRAFT_135722 [Schizothecium conicum]